MFICEENLKKFQQSGSCPVRNVADRFGDKWSLLILLILGEAGTRRFSEIKSTIGEISQKMLSSTLQKLEADGLVSRKVYPQVPPRTEYTLTERGEGLVPIIMDLVGWAAKNLDAIMESRASYRRERN